MAYKNYTEQQINAMLNETRSICRDTYMLLAAYILSSIKDMVEDEEHEMWGQRMPATLCSKVIKNCIEDFKEAGMNGMTVDVCGKPFSIREPVGMHPKKIWDIINFPKDGDDIIISKEGVWNVKSEYMQQYDIKKAEWERRRDYHRKVIKMAMTDDGWDKLTDMEVAMYCWCIWNKDYNAGHFISRDDVVNKWIPKYWEYFQIDSIKEIMGCFINDLTEDGCNYNSRAPFDVDKVAEWNSKHNQKSYADEISDDEIDDWWYDIGWEKFPIK